MDFLLYLISSTGTLWRCLPLRPCPSLSLSLYIYIFGRLGGLVQPGNRFVSFVRACAAVCKVRFDLKKSLPCFSLFPFRTGISRLFPLWDQVFPFPWDRWDQGNLSESKWDQVNPSEIEWVQVRSSESKWDQVNPREITCVQVRSSESKWIQMSPSAS